MRKSEIKILDKLWAEGVRLKAKYKCEYSGKTTALNTHHIFSRSNRTLRWDADNGVCLNAGYHTLGNWSAHKSPVEFIEWIKEKRGQEWYDRLRLRANVISKNQDFKLIKLELENQIKELRDE
jgi:hypothetical protein